MQMYLLLNNTCNLNCNFCIRGKQDVDKKVSLKDLEHVLKENDFSKYYLMITGGEPSLHEDLPQIIELCGNYFKGVSVNTNGVKSDWINNMTYTDFRVQISLDGTKEYHNEIRGNNKIDVYSKVLKTIDLLNSKNIAYNISSTVGKKNYNNIKLLCNEIDMFMGIKYWKVSPQLPFGCADVEDALDIREWNELVEYLLDNSDVLLSISKLFDFDLLDRFIERNLETYISDKNNCGNVKYKIYVYPDFTVYPCTCLTDFPLGNLLKDKLSHILSNSKSQMFRDYKVKAESVCYNCKYLPMCNGGCIGMSYHFFGEIGMGDFRCPLIKK